MGISIYMLFCCGNMYDENYEYFIFRKCIFVFLIILIFFFCLNVLDYVMRGWDIICLDKSYVEYIDY